MPDSKSDDPVAGVASAAALELPPPCLHADSGAVRFMVDLGDGRLIGASIAREVLHYRFNAALSGADAVSVYMSHRAEIDAAVRRRVASGSLEPVMLRENDLPAPPRGSTVVAG